MEYSDRTAKVTEVGGSGGTTRGRDQEQWQQNGTHTPRTAQEQLTENCYCCHSDGPTDIIVSTASVNTCISAHHHGDDQATGCYRDARGGPFNWHTIV